MIISDIALQNVYQFRLCFRWYIANYFMLSEQLPDNTNSLSNVTAKLGIQQS